jgi:hypothetical protein
MYSYPPTQAQSICRLFLIQNTNSAISMLQLHMKIHALAYSWDRRLSATMKL